MKHYFIIPGLGNSGPDHWQTYFEQQLPHCKRINQVDWEAPVCTDWIAAIEQALEGYDLSTVVLIGHSLGCLAIVHWARRYGKSVKAALLVAPSDAEADVYSFPATGFSPIPLAPLPFKSILITSSNDEWVSLERAQHFAHHWNSELINLGEAGHINVASGHTNWEAGLAIAKNL